jgi:hypothetical protein
VVAVSLLLFQDITACRPGGLRLWRSNNIFFRGEQVDSPCFPSGLMSFVSNHPIKPIYDDEGMDMQCTKGHVSLSWAADALHHDDDKTNKHERLCGNGPSILCPLKY